MATTKKNAALTWMEAHRAYDRTDALACKALADALPLGTVVQWKHGARWREGIVLSVSYTTYHCASVQVESTATGKTYWLGAYFLHDWLNRQGAR